MYGIVKQSGGYIEVESELGVGSEFTIYLPRAEGAPRPEGTEVPAAPNGEAVLVLEDEETLRELVREVLEGEGYTVLAAATAEAALALAAGHEVDLLLTDLFMSGPGGREVAERLRATRPELNVLYMSGQADAELPPQSAFLPKPFTLAELRIAVAGLLGPRD